MKSETYTKEERFICRFIALHGEIKLGLTDANKKPSREYIVEIVDSIIAEYKQLEEKEQTKNKIRLYRFFNVNKEAYGEPFGMCDKCNDGYAIPPFLVLEKLSDETDYACTHGDHKEE